MAEYVKKDLAMSIIMAAKNKLVADYAYAAASVLETYIDKMRKLPATDVAHVMPEKVVRCCECSFCDDTMRCQCDNSCKGLIREDDDFCSYGERRAT